MTFNLIFPGNLISPIDQFLPSLLRVNSVQTSGAPVVSGESTPVDFSLVGMFLGADLVVQVIMVGLLFASLWTWAIIFNKELELGGARRRARLTEEGIWSGRLTDELSDPARKPATNDSVARIFMAASREWRESQRAGGSETAMRHAIERAEKAATGAVDREALRLENGLGVLATIGSSAPFVGLFGTVWGIMNSFQSIAAAQDTSLAVVAPGIAEALAATAIGLFAAIPAGIFYNKFSTDIGRFATGLDHFSQELVLRMGRRLSGEGPR